MDLMVLDDPLYIFDLEDISWQEVAVDRLDPRGQRTPGMPDTCTGRSASASAISTHCR